MKLSTLTLLVLTSPLIAQNGKKLYQTHCSACHGTQGEGRKGAAPALSQSSWVNGDPNIITKLLLHGVQGPVTIHGESFELAMPAQTLLNDQQIADVATYVRNHWGNKAEAVSQKFVTKTRADTKSQSGMINSMHFTKPYDLKDHSLKLNNLLSSRYPFTTDFDSLADQTPASIEEEKGKFLNPLQVGTAKESFTAYWSGNLKVTQSGDYHFSLGSDHAARISVNGKVILDRKKGTPPSVGSINLEKGEAEVEIFYAHEAKTPIFFRLFLSGPKINMHRMHDSGKKKKSPPITINPTENRALVHRNFLVKGGERTLAVGFPQNINFYFSTEHMRLSHVWKGKFMEVGPTWNGRARGKIAKPLGKTKSVIEKGEIFKQFTQSISRWNEQQGLSTPKQFKAYSFDGDGNPTFSYQVGNYLFSDRFSVSASNQTLIRKVIIKTDETIQKPLYWKLLENTQQKSKTVFTNESGVQLEITSPEAKSKLLGKDLLLAITKPTTITLQYTWK